MWKLLRRRGAIPLGWNNHERLCICTACRRSLGKVHAKEYAPGAVQGRSCKRQGIANTFDDVVCSHACTGSSSILRPSPGAEEFAVSSKMIWKGPKGSRGDSGTGKLPGSCRGMGAQGPGWKGWKGPGDGSEGSVGSSGGSSGSVGSIG